MNTNPNLSPEVLIARYEERYLTLHAAKARIEAEMDIIKAVIRPLALNLFAPPDKLEVGRLTFSCRKTVSVKQMPAMRYLRGIKVSELESVFPSAFELKFGPRKKDDLVERFGEESWSDVVVGVKR